MRRLPSRARLARLLGVEQDELSVVAGGVAMFFLLFAGYFMLRPVRETMGIAGGVENLQWLFTGTFAMTLLALPLFGWLASRVRRRRILLWTYGFFTANLALFAVGFRLLPQDIWLARSFYIWLSVFNLLAISLAWSVLADLLSAAQAKRLFGVIAAGASLGGLVGPVAGTVLVGFVGHAGLLILAALLLGGSAGCAVWLQCWRDRHPFEASAEPARRSPLGGHPFAGAAEVARSPYLAGIAVFVVLLASANTFLYFEQARLVAATFDDRATQTQVFGLIDVAVQTSAILTQLFFTGRIARRLGVSVLLVAVPLAVALGFLWLALMPVFGVFAAVMVLRRAGEYALVRPGREMLFTVVSPEEKYKGKNFVDTVVYRGADAVSGWVKRGLDVLGDSAVLAMAVGAIVALLWGFAGAMLGRGYSARSLKRAARSGAAPAHGPASQCGGSGGEGL